MNSFSPISRTPLKFYGVGWGDLITVTYSIMQGGPAACQPKMLLSSIYIPDEPAIFERAIVRGQGDLTYIYISPWSPFATDR